MEMKDLLEKSKHILICWVLALIGSMIYSLFGVVGVFIFGAVGLLVVAYLTNRLIKQVRADAQAQLEQLKSEFKL